MKALPVLVAVLLLAAPIGAAAAPAFASGAIGAAQDADGTDPDTGPASSQEAITQSQPSNLEPVADRPFRVLTAPTGIVTAAGVNAHAPNLGPAVGDDVTKTTAAIRTEAIERRIENTDSQSERQRQILAAVNTVEQDEVSLNERQRNAIQSHWEGDLSDRELLVELAEIAAIARAYEERLDRLATLADETPEFSTPDRAVELPIQLAVYEGPVRAYALEIVRGETDPDRLYVETTPDAVVLTAIDDGEYVREVFRSDRWDRAGGDIDGDTAINATRTSYPETLDRGSTNTLGAGSIQRVAVPHDHGELRTYVSGGSEQVFVEQQRISLDAFDYVDPVSTTADGFNLTVDRTYAGGPVRVTVTDAETGAPIEDVSVTIRADGGASVGVGETDANGVVWTLSPKDSYRIAVLDDPRFADIANIEPVDPPRVADEADSDGTDSDSDDDS